MPSRDGQYDVKYEVEIELMYHPKFDYSPLKPGEKFSLIEGVKIVGAGEIISSIYERVNDEYY